MIHLERPDSRLAVAWVLMSGVALATGFWLSWVLLAVLTAHLVVSARWVMEGAGRKAMPLWEYFHWLALDAIDAEDADRQRKAGKR